MENGNYIDEYRIDMNEHYGYLLKKIQKFHHNNYIAHKTQKCMQTVDKAILLRLKIN